MFVLVLAGFFVPLGASVVPLFFSAGAGVSAGGMYRLLRIAAFTVMQAGLSAVGAVLIGTAAAFFTARRRFFGRRFLLSLSGIPLAVPPIIIALSFIIFFGRNGALNSVIMQVFDSRKPPIDFLYSLYGLIIAHAFYNFPIAMRTISQRWEQLNEDEEAAAMLLGAGKLRIFTTIILPSLAPAIAASFLIIFLYCFFSFVIVLLFGGMGTTVLEVELYQTIRSLSNPSAAARVILIELFFAAIITWVYVRIQKKASLINSALKQSRTRLPIRGRYEKLGFILVAGSILFFLLAPLMSVFLRSFTHITYAQARRMSFQPWESLISSSVFWKAFWTTVWTGCAAAALSVVTALVFAYIQVIKNWRVSMLPFFPIMISSLAVGFGWMQIVRQSSVLVLIVSQAALAWPFAWTQIQIAVTRIPPTVLNSARILSSPQGSFFMTLLPLSKKGIKTAFAYTFAISAGNASLPLVLGIPGFQNIALLVFRLAGSYRFSESAAAAAVLTILTAFVFFLQDEPIRT